MSTDRIYHYRSHIGHITKCSDELMEKLWGDGEFVDDNTLTVNVTRVRKKLEATGCTDGIKTKKGIGYILE